MEELYREESTASGDRKIISAVALLVIAGMFVYEIMNLLNKGHFNLLGWGMNFCLLGLWIWRNCYHYTLILYRGRLAVITHGPGVNRRYEVDLTRTESFTNRYVRSFFRKTRISHYVHRYNSLDSNTQRLLVFTEGKKNKLAGLLFKASDDFVKQLRRQMPDKYLEL